MNRNTSIQKILKISLCLIGILFLSVSYSQKDKLTKPEKRAKHVPLFISYSYKPLTTYLTANLRSDEEKVKSISLWIANNIKYDVKMYITDKRKVYSPNKTLRKRKAICQGYAELFVAMCEHANIPAYVVVGYDKGGGYFPEDIFVRDDHAWNAVYFGESWHLLDLTWAAGTLTPKKQRFRRLLYYMFGVPFKVKYKFKKAFDAKYILPEPNQFAEDHCPAHPWWQLTSKEMPIDIFENEVDTIQAFFPAPIKQGSLDLSLESRTDPLHHFEKAKEAHQFNDKNFRILAEGKALYGYEWYEETKEADDPDFEANIEIYDSCMVLFKEASRDMRIYNKWMKVERSVRIDKNKTFGGASKKIMVDEIKSNNLKIKVNLKKVRVIKKQKGQLKKEKASLKRDLKKFRRFRLKIKVNTKPLSFEKEQKIEELKRHISEKADSIQDDIKLYYKNLNKMKGPLDTLRVTIRRFNSLVSIQEQTVKKKKRYRRLFHWGYEDSIVKLEDVQLKTLAIKDSTFKTQNGYVDELSGAMKQSSADLKSLRKQLNKNFKASLKLARTGINYLTSRSYLDSVYNKTMGEWKTYSGTEVSCAEVKLGVIEHEKSVLYGENKRLRSESKKHRREKRIEVKRYNAYNSYYTWFFNHERRKSAGYVSNLKKYERKMRKEIEAEQRKLHKQEAEEKAAAKKAKG